MNNNPQFKSDVMYLSLIICTYQRPVVLMRLLNSVISQTLYPNEIIIVDGSKDDSTEEALKAQKNLDLKYFRVNEYERGLTKQRNYGVERINSLSEVICFLDDDIILSDTYFEELLHAYSVRPEALGVSGYITNEAEWFPVENSESIKSDKSFYYDGWGRVEGSRFSLRRRFGLAPDAPPGFMPDFSHGYSTGFLPPSGKIYEVEMLMGGLASYKTEIFEDNKFSSYFEGYGLYEDADFSLRIGKLGKLYVNTNARLEHHHAPEGRPDMFLYGKMVVRNGWYVWRVKYKAPSFKAKFKWHSTSFLLTLVRLGNIFTTSTKKEALMEGLGRIGGWISLLFNKPAHENKRT